VIPVTDPDRLRKIEELYHATRESPPETRAKLLEEADPDLRQQVESLLERDTRPGPLDRPALVALQDSDPVPLPAGAQLGPYRIDKLLGNGGMGRVYRALDTRLGRAVAVKIVRERFTALFQGEARAISSLNHPHICTLYDVGPDYLVMELLQGETLAARLKKGALPRVQALRLASEVADALAAAHIQGVIHRDLKPGNIMLTNNGVKVLDFGLAKIGAAEEPLGDPGTILGTRRYMSPEQAEGKPMDARSDIYSFGAVLYEMLTGRPASEAGSPVGEGPGPLSALPAELEWILGRLLAKDQAERWQSARDLKVVLERFDSVGVSGSQPSEGVGRGWIAAAVLAVIAGALLTIQLRRNPPEPRMVRFQIANAGTGPPALSPDGSKIVFSSGPGGTLMVRSLDALSAEGQPGTEGGYSPFWSPDGRWIGFFVSGHLKKVSAEVGPPLAITDVDSFAGVGAGTWGRDGAILYSPSGLFPLSRVPAAGGRSAPAGKFGPARAPWSLPDAKHFLFTMDATAENNGIFVGSLDPPEHVRVLPEGHSPEYSDSGYLLFIRRGALMAQPFDVRKLQVSGDAALVASPVGSFSVAGSALVYQRGESEGERRLRWYDRHGTVLEDTGQPADYRKPELSPDRRQIAYVTAIQPRDVWVYDLIRGTTSRLTFDGGLHGNAGWSPDGREIAVTTGGGPNRAIQRIDVNGGRNTTLAVQFDRGIVLWQWTADGKYLIFTATGGEKPYEVWAVPLSGGKPFPVIWGPFNNHQGRVSPNGKWIAYVSEETGRMEVYVQDFPSKGRKWRISTAGGEIARWRGDSRELFYREGSKMMSVEVNAAADKLEFGVPKPLFDASPPLDPYFDVTPDGRKFLLMVPNTDATTAASFTVVLNWPAGIKK
jgi:serine/threonine protein kinase